MKRYQYPPSLFVACLKWLRLQQGQDGSELKPVTRCSMYSDSTMIYLFWQYLLILTKIDCLMGKHFCIIQT